jgi:hypothetical protein
MCEVPFWVEARWFEGLAVLGWYGGGLGGPAFTNVRGPAPTGVVVAVFAVLIGGLVIYQLVQMMKRRALAAERAAQADALGLTFASGDPLRIVRSGWMILRQGGTHRVHTTITGSWNGTTVQVFDCSYYRTKQKHPWICAAREIPKTWPHILVWNLPRPPGMGGLRRAGLVKLEPEFGEPHRAWHVASATPKGSGELVDQQ